MCEGADQLLFGAGSGGGGSASQGALGVRGDLAPGTVRGETRTLFRPTTEGTEPGALPGGADEEARRFRRFDTAGTVAGTGTLAGELRSVLGDAEATPRQTRWNPSHDRGTAAGPSVWLCSAEGSAGEGSGSELFRRQGRASADECGTQREARAERNGRDRGLAILRSSPTHDGEL